MKLGRTSSGDEWLVDCFDNEICIDVETNEPTSVWLNKDDLLKMLEAITNKDEADV
jgi:hypothetical protein